jgi:hypothetical protein
LTVLPPAKVKNSAGVAGPSKSAIMFAAPSATLAGMEVRTRREIQVTYSLVLARNIVRLLVVDGCLAVIILRSLNSL